MRWMCRWLLLDVDGPPVERVKLDDCHFRWGEIPNSLREMPHWAINFHFRRVEWDDERVTSHHHLFTMASYISSRFMVFFHLGVNKYKHSLRFFVHGNVRGMRARFQLRLAQWGVCLHDSRNFVSIETLEFAGTYFHGRVSPPYLRKKFHICPILCTKCIFHPCILSRKFLDNFSSRRKYYAHLRLHSTQKCRQKNCQEFCRTWF